MTRFIYGLNVNKSFADIPDPEKALENLGLNIRDLDIIRGISNEGVTKNDIVRISNLDVDARKELATISGDLRQSTLLTQFAPDVRRDITTDHIIDNQLSARSFKYNYIAYDNGNQILGADISTSRVSSWSTFESPVTSTSPILYGGDVEVIPTPATSNSQVKVDQLTFNQAPIQKRFAAEVPTHLITIEVGGAQKQIYAMKGIPIIFEGYFRTANLKSVVTNFSGILPTWLITNKDNGVEYAPYENVALSYELEFVDSVARPRQIEFFYPPSNIRELELSSINLNEWTNVVLPSLVTANLAFNDLRDMPNFNTLTPNLTSLNVHGNDMSRSVNDVGVQIVANTQLSRLPTTLNSLIIDGCFSDNTDIDISYLSNLQTFRFDTNYEEYVANRDSRRRQMTSIGSTPKVNSSTISSYTVRHQPYRKLDTSVTSSSSIRSVNIDQCNIASDSSNAEIAFNNNSNNMVSFISYNNPHNIVNLSGHDRMTQYWHRTSRNLVGSSSIEGIFAGCDSLKSISLYATDATGNFDGTIANLGSLEYCDMRFTLIHGKVSSTAFSGTSKLRNLYFARSFLGLDSSTPATATQYTNTFDNDSLTGLSELRYLFCYNAPYVTGDIPDMSQNTNLIQVYLDNSRFTGGLTNFNTNRNMRLVFARYNLLNQTVPVYSSQSITGLYLNNNLLYGRLQAFECINLAYLYLNNNNLGKDQSGATDSSLGQIPTFIGNPRLLDLKLNNNFFTSYTAGAIRNNTRIRDVSFANNRLSFNDVFSILSDLNDNWTLNNRSGVRVDLRGNNVTEDVVINDSIAGETLAFLRSRGWSIFI
jgi:hypothetical protein